MAASTYMPTDSPIINLKKIHVSSVKRLPPLPIYFECTKGLDRMRGKVGEGLKMVERLENDTLVGQGLQASSSKSLVRFNGIEVDKLKNYIIDPSSIPDKESRLLQSSQGEILPYNLPDISDLALHPKTVKVLFEWMLVNCSEVDFAGYVSILMRESAPELPIRVETCLIQEGKSTMTVRSFSNTFKAIDINTSVMREVTLEATSRQTTSDKRDGRTCELSFLASKKEKLSLVNEICEGNHMSILLWNCRGMAHEMFTTVLDHLVELHWPDFVLLLETRVSDIICNTIIRRFGFKTICLYSPDGLAGGLALLGKGKKPQVSCFEKRSEGLFWCKLL